MREPVSSQPPDADRHPGARAVQYKGAPLDADRGPGLGCFWVQLVILAIAVVITPLSVAWSWPEGVSAALLFVVIVLLLFTGQTVIFLLRLVAADRRTEGRRRRPLASATLTVGELEDERAAARPMSEQDAGADEAEAAAQRSAAEPTGKEGVRSEGGEWGEGSEGSEGGVRQ